MAKQLIVAGFHRSGTSLIMQYLHRCGLFIGYDLIGANDSNPYGHFEDREIVRTHDWILAANQVSWMIDEPFAPVLEAAHWTRLREIIGKRDTEHSVWGFKDPRVCNFLVHWKSILPDAKVLIVFRNPCKCIHSLHRRHAHELFKQKGNPEVHRRFFREPDLALRMWNVHNAALIAFARAHPGDVLVLHHGTFTDGFPLAAKLNELWDFGLEELSVSEVYDHTIARSAPAQTPVRSADPVNEALEIWQTLAAMETKTTGATDLLTKDTVNEKDFVFDQDAAGPRMENELLKFESVLLDDEIKRLRLELRTNAENAVRLQHKISAIKESLAWKIAQPVWKLERRLSSRRVGKKDLQGSSARRSRQVAHKLKDLSKVFAQHDVGTHIRDRGFAVAAAVLPPEYRNAAITIIVPVYNAASDVNACLESVLEHTTIPAKALVIDDASTDPNVRALLKEFEDMSGITLIRNERNIGFTRSVNKGIALAGPADVVLLNSDAIVTPRWLENLHLAAYSHSRIATVTPLSDNAGAFSVPEYGEANASPAWANPDVYARMITQTSAMLRPSVPTGNGFCMYIRRSCIDEVGTLDEATFPRGYGEENDFCMRALHSGWINVVDDRTIVYHRGSASFGEGKHELLRQAAAILNNRYPEYRTLTKVFKGEHFDLVRDRVRRLNAGSTAQRETGKPRVLFVISVGTGGTALTNRDLMEGVRDRFQPWLLRCDSRKLELSYLGSEGIMPVASHTLAEPIIIAKHVSDEYDRVVEQWLVMYAIELVHIRHISWNSLNLVRSCKSLHIPVIFSFHDFYCVCPTVKLLDENMKFCHGICTETPGECAAALWPKDTVPPLKNRWIRNWRLMMRRMLLQCDAFVTTSVSARQIIVTAYPELDERDFSVIPHGRSFKRMHECARRPERDEPVKILAVGNINAAKGGDIIAELIKQDKHRRFEFHILGKVDHKLHDLRSSRVVMHGPYEREEVVSKIMAITPHLGAIFSVWGETYCHTLTELWACGLPVLTFDMGALGERIRAAGGGWLLPHDDLDALFASICEIANDYDGINDRVAEVRAWQCGEGRRNNLERMANSYMSLYGRVVEARRTFSVANGRVSTFGRRPASLAKAVP